MAGNIWGLRQAAQNKPSNQLGWWQPLRHGQARNGPRQQAALSVKWISIEITAAEEKEGRFFMPPKLWSPGTKPWSHTPCYSSDWGLAEIQSIQWISHKLIRGNPKNSSSHTRRRGNFVLTILLCGTIFCSRGSLNHQKQMCGWRAVAGGKPALGEEMLRVKYPVLCQNFKTEFPWREICTLKFQVCWGKKKDNLSSILNPSLKFANRMSRYYIQMFKHSFRCIT